MNIINKTIKDIKSFTIDREKWVRGNIGGDSKLLNEQGNMCCLGQYLKACGFDDEELKNTPSPEFIARYIKREQTLNNAWLSNLNQTHFKVINWKTKLVKGLADSETVDQLISHNDEMFNFKTKDYSIISEKEREKLIRAGFAKLGIKVKFKN